MNKRMRVLHFIDSGGLYGAESVLLNLSRKMRDSGRYEPVVGCIVASPQQQNDLYDKALELGLEAEKIVIRNPLLPLDLPRVARRLKKLKIDLIHSHGYKPSVFGHAIKLISGIEVMATCHLWFKGSKGPLKMRVMVALELMLYKKFPVVVGVSEPIKKVLIDAGIPEEKIQVVQNGVPVGDEVQVDEGAVAVLRDELDLGPDDFCLINTGRLTKQKAQTDIVTAARLLQERGIKGRYLIVGEGNLKTSLADQIADAGLSASVQLLGFRDDITELLELADLFLLPSLDEGMPMSLLEAGAVGKCVVVTEVGDVPKLVAHGQSGSIVPAGKPEELAEAIAALMDHPEDRRRMGEAIQERVRLLYSNEVMFDRYDQVYQSLV